MKATFSTITGTVLLAVIVLVEKRTGRAGAA
jgi:hypothetical protein